MTLPNIISLGRLLCVPLMVWVVLNGRLDLAFWIFLGAGISDGIDGFLAKRFDWRTPLGSFLDPMADKALLVSIYILLGAKGFIPSWLVFLVVLRDVLILGGAALVFRFNSQTRIDPMWLSKANTVAQIVFAGYVLALNGFGFHDPGVERPLTYFVAVTTFASGLGYVLKWGRRASRMGASP